MSNNQQLEPPTERDGFYCENCTLTFQDHSHAQCAHDKMLGAECPKVCECECHDTTPSTSAARQAATEIAYEMNGGDRKDLTYPKPWRDLFDDPSIANEAAFAAWVEAIILKYISPVGEQKEDQNENE